MPGASAVPPRPLLPLRKLALLFFPLALALQISIWTNPGWFNHDELQLLDRFVLGEWTRPPWTPLLETAGGGFHRPLAWNLEVLLLWAGGASPPLVHLAAALETALAGWLCLLLALRLGLSPLPSLLAGLLFACGPTAARATAWTMGIFDRSWTLFALASLCLLPWTEKGPRMGTGRALLVGLGLLGALLCKETAIVLLPLFLVLALALHRSGRVRGRATVVLAACLFALGLWFWRTRFSSLHVLAEGDSREFGYRVAFGSNLAANLFDYLAFPFALGSDSLANLRALAPFPARIAAAAAMLLAAFLLLTRRGPIEALGFAAAFALPLVPVLPLHKVEGQYLYPAGVGLALALGRLVRERGATAVLALLLSLVLVLQGQRILTSIREDGRTMAALLEDLGDLARRKAREGRLEIPVRIRAAEASRDWVLDRALVGRRQAGGVLLADLARIRPGESAPEGALLYLFTREGRLRPLP